MTHGTKMKSVKHINEITKRIQMQLRTSGVRRAPNKLSPSLQKQTRKKLKKAKIAKLDLPFNDSPSRSPSPEHSVPDLPQETCPAPSPQSLHPMPVQVHSRLPTESTTLFPLQDCSGSPPVLRPILTHGIGSPTLTSFTKKPTYVPQVQQPLQPPIQRQLPASPSIQKSALGSLSHQATSTPCSMLPLYYPIQQHISLPNLQQMSPSIQEATCAPHSQPSQHTSLSNLQHMSPPIEQATCAPHSQPSQHTSLPNLQHMSPPIQQATRAPHPQPSQHTSPPCIQQPVNVPSTYQSSSSHFLNHEVFNLQVNVPSIPKSIRSKPQGKHKRGIVNGFRLQMKTRTSSKIHVEVEEDGKNPKCPAIRSLLVHEIGSCIRDNVPMIATRYTKLPKDQWEVVPRHLSTNFELPPNEEWLWDFILKIAKSRYKDWKCKCKKHFDENGEELPQEFVYRPEQWEWLVNHFKDPLQQNICLRMKRIRRDCPRINHHSGKLPLHHRAELLSRDGFKLPYIAAYENAYGSDPNGAEIVKEVNDKARELLEERGVYDLGLLEDSPLTMHEQMEIIEEVVNKRKGNKSKGRPRKNLQSYIDMQEEIRKTKDEALAKETAAAAKLMAVEERLRILEDLWQMTNRSPISSGASHPNLA